MFAIAIVFCILLTPRLVASSDAQANAGVVTLALSVSADRTGLSVGDPIHLVFTLKNVSNATVLFFASAEGNWTDYIRLRGVDGIELRDFTKALVRHRTPSQADFRVFEPGDEWSFNLSAVLQIQTNADYGTPGAPDVRGVFLDFGDSAIHIPTPGRYALTGRFQQAQKMVRDLEVWFTLSELWHGELLSEPLDVEMVW